ncbi:energy transducer TonB [Aquimarina rhabdastrellae]
MRVVLLILTLCFSTLTHAQGIVLSKESATDKGVSPIWPKCEKSNQDPSICFDNQLRLHIIRTFQYPELALEDKLEGTVTVEFIINQKGKVEVVDVQGGHRYLQREAIRIIRKIPKMKPGKWGKKPISVAYITPITFRKPQ